jgi:NADPH:quinone reductase-like Zn-dependent oxidoreductase
MPKAVVCRELGPPESLRLETFDAAPLASGQVRVAIRAAGINFPDILMAAGEYQLKPPLPFTPGVEAAGDVVEVNAAEGQLLLHALLFEQLHVQRCVFHGDGRLIGHAPEQLVAPEEGHGRLHLGRQVKGNPRADGTG